MIGLDIVYCVTGGKAMQYVFDVSSPLIANLTTIDTAFEILAACSNLSSSNKDPQYLH